MKENFIHFMKRFQKLDGRGFGGSQIDMLRLDNFLQFFLTNLENMENIDFYIFLFNTNEN